MCVCCCGVPFNQEQGVFIISINVSVRVAGCTWVSACSTIALSPWKFCESVNVLRHSACAAQPLMFSVQHCHAISFWSIALSSPCCFHEYAQAIMPLSRQLRNQYNWPQLAISYCHGFVGGGRFGSTRTCTYALTYAHTNTCRHTRAHRRTVACATGPAQARAQAYTTQISAGQCTPNKC